MRERERDRENTLDTPRSCVSLPLRKTRESTTQGKGKRKSKDTGHGPPEAGKAKSKGKSKDSS